MSRPHVLFYEPRFTQQSSYLWNVRGAYKYASIVGDLKTKADITVLMSSLPPSEDPHRRNLERNFGFRFRQFHSLDIAIPGTVEALAEDLSRTFRKLCPTVVSNLNGRAVGFNYAVALAAQRSGLQFVLRFAGNDIEVRGKVAESRGESYWGTEVHMEQLVQERIAAHLSQRIIVMSKREQKRITGLCDQPTKISICYRGVDQSAFFPRDQAHNECRQFLFIGRRSYEKGYDILEEAANVLRERRSDIEISFAGTFEKEVKENRKYLGYVEYADLPALYREHQALVVCSRSEGFPQVVMEAMSCGIPCLLPPAIFRDDFSDGDGCLLVEPEPTKLADAMLRLRHDAGLYAKLRITAAELAKRNYSEVDNRRRYHDLLLDK